MLTCGTKMVGIAALMVVSASLAACSQKSRGPASTEAKDLMRNAPPPVVAEGPPPTEPDMTVPAPPQPARPPAEVAVQPAPTQPAPAQPVVPPQPFPDIEIRRGAATTPATAAATTTAATVPVTEPITRPMRIHVAADADEATRLRNWPVSVAYYANGNTVGGPVYRLVPAPPKRNRYRDLMLHEGATTALAVPQIIITPLWVLINPPWKAVEYHGEELPPSYTLDEEVPYYQNEKVPGIVEIGR